MKTKVKLIAGVIMALSVVGSAQAVVIDMTGGTAYGVGGGVLGVTNNSNLFQDNVAYYEEEGIRISFNHGDGTVGAYDQIGAVPVYNDTVHLHWGMGDTIVFSNIDNSSFDLTYFDVVANTITGGGQSTGGELSYITTNTGYSMLLPSSDWGFGYDYFGQTGDDVVRLWLDSNFHGITSFTVTSSNAYCFALDQFYVDQEAPPQVPIPGALWLFGSGVAGLIAAGKRKKAATASLVAA
jgi:hypothetical protein